MTETTTEPTATTEPEGPEGAKKPDSGELSDAGKRAIAEERQARREAERKAAEASDEAAKLKAEQARGAVAAEKELTPEQAKLLRGESTEEMGKHADELLAAFKPSDEGEQKAQRRPREALRSGAAPNSEPEELGKVAGDLVKEGW